jgi:hypothetical protein
MAYRDKAIQGHFDLESTEMYIRDSMHQIGAVMLEELLNSDNVGSQFQGKIISDSDNKNHQFKFKEYRDKRLITVLGPVNVERAYYYNEKIGKGYCPKDRLLDIERSSFSPGMRRIMCRVGAYRPFSLGHEDIKEMAGIEVSSKEIERVCYRIGFDVERYFKDELDKLSINNVIPIKSVDVDKMYVMMDGTGVPVVKKETKNRKGKGENGQAKTREAKLGCIFTQSAIDKKGYPIRDEGSTSYVGSIETAEEFEGRIYNEALMRGLEKAKKVCVIGDGAQWIWNIADFYFHGAIQIIDLYHAREHYWKVARKMFPDDNKKLKAWTSRRRKELDLGDVEKVIAAMKRLAPSLDEQQEEIKNQIGYFEKNKARMRYKKFREQGLFVGSGVVEAGCKNVIGQRLKQSGMHWTVNGANKIIALRCCLFSNRWEDYWEYRAIG